MYPSNFLIVLPVYSLVKSIKYKFWSEFREPWWWPGQRAGSGCYHDDSAADGALAVDF